MFMTIFIDDIIGCIVFGFEHIIKCIGLFGFGFDYLHLHLTIYLTIHLTLTGIAFEFGHIVKCL